MKQFILKLLLIGALACGVILCAEWRHEEQEFDPEALIEAFLDSGIQICENESVSALMEERKIIVTSGVNSNFSRTLISRLIQIDNSGKDGPIDLYLRTEGGWEGDAFAVIDTIKSLKSPVNIHALGDVHSAGLMILASATGKRYVYPHTILGFHAAGDDEDEIYKNRYLHFWTEVAKLPEEWLERRDEEMSYFDPADALKYKVADELIGSD